jgi:CBS domain containing-hemolysin-like protein
MLGDIIITFFLVFLNGFFVAAEFAMVKVRSSQLEIKAAAGNRISKAALSIVQNLDGYLSATQLGITLASLGLGWIGQSVVSKLIINLMLVFSINMPEESANQIALPIAFTLITILHIVFGELAPKTIAIQRSEATTLAVTYPMKAFYFIFRPFIWALNGLATILLRVMGFPANTLSEVHTAEEIQYLIEQSTESGEFEAAEHELIKNVFNFNLITVRQIMVPRTSICAIDMDLKDQEIIELIIREGYSRMPVYKDSIDNIIGISYIKDFLKMIGNKEPFDLKSVTRPPYFVPNTKKISELLKELQDKHLHMAIITDEFGGIAGLVTIEDILEELVGEIQDEHDEEAPIVEKLNHKEYVVNALSSIEDVNEFLPVPLPKSNNYDTVAGMVNTIFDKIPDLYEKTSSDVYDFTILKKSKQSVLVVKLQFNSDNLSLPEQ